MAINAKRLLKLADYLETVPSERFFMSHWQRSSRRNECGFSGCAIGWAVEGKLFKGLELRPVGDAFQSHQPYYRPNGASRAKSSFRAIESLFSITPKIAMSIFTENREAEPRDTPHTVAQRIRKFVRDHSKGAA